MFKITITKEYTEIDGTLEEKLAGLACYASTLYENGYPRKAIEKAVRIGLEDNKEEKVETILDNDNLKIQKFDLNNMTKEEAEEILKKELLDKLFD